MPTKTDKTSTSKQVARLHFHAKTMITRFLLDRPVHLERLVYVKTSAGLFNKSLDAKPALTSCVISGPMGTAAAVMPRLEAAGAFSVTDGMAAEPLLDTAPVLL